LSHNGEIYRSPIGGMQEGRRPVAVLRLVKEGTDSVFLTDKRSLSDKSAWTFIARMLAWVTGFSQRSKQHVHVPQVQQAALLEEHSALHAACQQERSILLADLAILTRHNKLRDLLIQKYIPSRELEAIRQSCLWDQESREWHLQNRNFAGNPLREPL
jgi:hypothetical protein